MRKHFGQFGRFRGFCGGEGFRGERHEQSGPWAGFREFGGGRHGFRGRWGGGGSGPGRMFAAGDLRYVILQLISEKASHGYEIIKSIQEKLGGSYAPSPGVVYPMLTMLEEMGWASAVTEGTRKL